MAKSWTTTQAFTLDATIAARSQMQFKPLVIPEYTYKLSTVGHKRIRPRCEDLEQVVVIRNVTHGRID